MSLTLLGNERPIVNDYKEATDVDFPEDVLTKEAEEDGWYIDDIKGTLESDEDVIIELDSLETFDNGTVILNDHDTPDKMQLEVPINISEDAMDDNSDYMVSTDDDTDYTDIVL